MKKILLILITGLFISTNVYSDHNNYTKEIENEIVEKNLKEQGLNVELHVVKGGHEFKQLKGRTEIMKAAIKQ